MPAISVIMPVYNKENYIEASLRSVLDQPFRDLEVIAVNDGSTDGSLAILTRMAQADPRIRVVDIPNGGVSNARNTGLAHAAGEWIQFLDADDLLEPDYLTAAMQVLEAHPADILFSGFTMVDAEMNPVKGISIPQTDIQNQAQLCRTFMEHQYRSGFFGFISNKLFSRRLWERSGARFPVGTTLAEDLDFYARMYPAVETAYFWNGKSFYYLQTETNYTHNPKIDYFSQLEIHLDIQAWFRKSGQYQAYRPQLDSKIAQYASFVLSYANEEGQDVAAAFADLRGRPEIMDCIDPQCMRGFHRMLLMALRGGNLTAVKALFAVRNTVRSIYRRVRK